MRAQFSELCPLAHPSASSSLLTVQLWRIKCENHSFTSSLFSDKGKMRHKEQAAGDLQHMQAMPFFAYSSGYKYAQSMPEGLFSVKGEYNYKHTCFSSLSLNFQDVWTLLTINQQGTVTRRLSPRQSNRNQGFRGGLEVLRMPMALQYQ